MKKFITCYRNRILHIIKFEIVELNSTLRLLYEIFQIKQNLSDKYKSIEESFKNNPESVTVFNNIQGNIEKVFTNSISQIEAGEYISKSVIDYNNLLNIGNLVLPKISINIENYKLIVVYNIIKFFFEHYDEIKFELNKNENAEVLNQNKLIIKKIEINDIIKLINNNMIVYFLFFYLNNLYYNLKYNKFELNNRTLKIYINNIILENNTTHSKNLYLLINNISESSDEINNLINILFKTLIKFINSEILTSDNNFNEELIIKLNILNFLCFIYGIKFLSDNKISHEKLKYLSVLNKIYLHLLKNTKINNLDFDRIEIYESLSLSGGEIDNFVDLESISKKYKYLTALSSKEFIKAVISDVKNYSGSRILINNNLTLKTPKILNIDYILTLDNDCDSYIKFNKIKTPEFIKLEKKFVITEEYLQILYLINSNGFIEHSKLNVKVVKFADLIINDILPEVDKKHEMLISTLIIMTEIINELLKLKPMIDFQSKFFIIYRIILPHLYNKYNINKFIDYFL